MRNRPLACTLSVALALIASLAVALPPDMNKATDVLKASPRHGDWVDIAMPDGTKLHTWVSYPERSGKAPVVLVIHEIFGMTDWVRGVADALAADGFIAIAPDFLSAKGPNGGNTESFAGDQVRAAVGQLTPDEIVARLDAAKAYAATLPAADATKLGTVGFCWGGTQTFLYATRQPELKAAVVYYGTGPQETEALKKIAAPVLGQYGGDDARVTSTVEPQKTAMAAAGKSYEPVVHAGAGHGFLRQQEGRDGANENAAKAAWDRTIAFFRERLGK